MPIPRRMFGRPCLPCAPALQHTRRRRGGREGIMARADFIVVGSSGGGGTISWLLAKAGFKVLVLEQGPDFAKDLEDGPLLFNPREHDEYRYRLRRPDPKRRLRGDYNTFRTQGNPTAKPFGN